MNLKGEIWRIGSDCALARTWWEKAMDREDIEQALDECLSVFNARNQPFTQWEQEFLESVNDQYQERKSLSDKQLKTVEALT